MVDTDGRPVNGRSLARIADSNPVEGGHGCLLCVAR